MTGTGAPAASGPQMLLGLGIDEVQEQVRVWSVPTTIGWAVSAVP